MIGHDSMTDVLSNAKSASTVHCEESVFHEIIGSFSDQPLDFQQHLQLVGRYAEEAQDLLERANQASHRFVLESLTEHQESSPQELRAERDLWSLLHDMAAGDALGPLNDAACDQDTSAALRELSPLCTVPDFINAAFGANGRLRKGGIALSWLENGARDLVHPVDAPRCLPWAESLASLGSAHPDAQLSREGEIRPLAGADADEQEIVLKAVWQLLRSGQLAEAQQLAFEHRLHWLAAILRGGEHHNYVISRDDADSEDESIARIGNLRQPLWMRTCWKYCETLAKRHSTSGSSAYQTHLEFSIFAALSNNLGVLLDNSLLVRSWHDRVWALVKAAHSRDLMRLQQQYRVHKMNASSFFPATERGLCNAEDELLCLLDEQLGAFSLSGLEGIERFASIPSSNDACGRLIRLQMVFLQGHNSIKQFMEGELLEWLDSIATYPGKSVVLRIVCHLLLWMRTSPANSSSNLSELVSADLLFFALEAYIDQLVAHKQFSLVAHYCTYLSRPRRVEKYASLLLAMQCEGVKTMDEEGACPVLVASELFPEDVVEITRTLFRKLDQPTVVASHLDEVNIWHSTQHDVSKDAMVLAALSWLSRSDDLRREWICQANRWAARLLRMSPASLLCFMSALDQSHMEEDGKDLTAQLANDLQSAAQRGDVIAHFAASQMLNESQSHCDKFCFWNKICSATTSVQRWTGSLRAGEEVKQHTIDSLDKSYCLENVLRAADDSLQSIIQCLLFDDGLLQTANGFMELWDVAQESSCEIILALLNWALMLLNKSPNANLSERTNSLESAVDVEMLRTSISSVLSTISQQYNRCSVTNPSGFSQLPVLVSSMSEVFRKTTMHWTVNELFSLSCTLHQCSDRLNDIIFESELKRFILPPLLEMYTDICLESSGFLVEGKKEEDACLLLEKALELSNLIASEESCLQLHSIISRRDLEKILQRLNSAAIQLLNMKPDFLWL